MSDAAINLADLQNILDLADMYICWLRSRLPAYLVITPLASTTRVDYLIQRQPRIWERGIGKIFVLERKHQGRRCAASARGGRNCVVKTINHDPSLLQTKSCNPVVYFTPLETSPVDRPAKLALDKRATSCPVAPRRFDTSMRAADAENQVCHPLLTPSALTPTHSAVLGCDLC